LTLARTQVAVCPTGDIHDNKSPGEDTEQPGTGKMSRDPESPELPESEYHFDFRPDTSSEGSDPADHEPIPNERNCWSNINYTTFIT
jgi:hypothetical protein